MAFKHVSEIINNVMEPIMSDDKWDKLNQFLQERTLSNPKYAEAINDVLEFMDELGNDEADTPITKLPIMENPEPVIKYSNFNYASICETVMIASVIFNIILLFIMHGNTHRCISKGTYGAVTAWECSGQSATPITGFSFKNAEMREQMQKKGEKVLYGN